MRDRHAVLSRDPRARSPLRWELDDPSPPPRASFRDDPRFPAYQFHRQALQHMQAFAPRDFWALKSPLHMHWMDELLTYPDARIIVAHRDPAQVVPSLASWTHHGRTRLGPVDPRKSGREVLEEYSTATERMISYRARHPRPDRFIDVNHVDLVRTPMEVMQTIYEKFGIELTDEAHAAMTAFLADNRSGHHGQHRYTAEEFGLSEAAIRERCRPYIETYGVPLAS